ncbi:MAG TPA: HTTM domain-containing protein [Polyangiaceae bacterium]|nr:HTTM domain-containing protein [Polyangiaceae bacterium]
MAPEKRIRRALTEPAYGLAALRIVVVAMLLITPELRQAPALAAAPERLVAAPEGLGWLADFQFSPTLVSGMRLLAYSAGACALLGYWSRLSCAVLALAATFLLSFAERVGATLHAMHMLWLLALLAASRSGDVWSLDAWGRAVPAPSITYGVPLCAARALLGVVYFFPGLHKLLSGGLEWGSAANVTAIMYGKWFQHGRLPELRIDHYPVLLALGGLGVLMFELSFIVLALLPKTRVVALGLGLAFHLSTRLFFFIDFPSLWGCYVVLLPWQCWLGRRTPAAREPVANWPRASLVVGGALLLATAVQGARGQTQAYPFACYPTFEGLMQPVAPDLVVELVAPDGHATRLERDFGRYRTQQQWGTVYWLLGAYGHLPGDAPLRAFAREQAQLRGGQQELDRAQSLRLLAANYSTRPEDWGKPPLGTRVLRELAP